MLPPALVVLLGGSILHLLITKGTDVLDVTNLGTVRCVPPDDPLHPACN